MFSVNLHEFKPIQALDCINLNMTIHKYELLPGLIGALFSITFTNFHYYFYDWILLIFLSSA